MGLKPWEGEMFVERDESGGLVWCRYDVWCMNSLVRVSKNR